jgi:hypothetical protein
VQGLRHQQQEQPESCKNHQGIHVQRIQPSAMQQHRDTSATSTTGTEESRQTVEMARRHQTQQSLMGDEQHQSDNANENAQ